LAFDASSSKQSINKKLVTYASILLEKTRDDVSVDIIDINDYELPLFSLDKEEELGQPDLAKAFYQKITDADAVIVSFAEHNGSYTAAYKNLFDWASRIEVKVFQDKAMVLLANSPGPGGARSVLSAAETSAPFFGGNVKGTLSVASFFDNFDSVNNEISNSDIDQELRSALVAL
ncbi:NADPH-dependent FMN reductase, partial [Kiloniella sp.]|uniref:NADPH-dependent FMN reductase n=1 Tax=Kiloniella sp. TaxID=1938587 RepID=UPI003B02D0F8